MVGTTATLTALPHRTTETITRTEEVSTVAVTTTPSDPATAVKTMAILAVAFSTTIMEAPAVYSEVAKGLLPLAQVQVSWEVPWQV